MVTNLNKCCSWLTSQDYKLNENMVTNLNKYFFLMNSFIFTEYFFFDWTASYLPIYNTLFCQISPSCSRFQCWYLFSVLNGCTRRGPFLANSLGIIALMYCSLDSLIEKVRGEEDQLNSIAAAASAGMIFKSTGKLSLIGWHNV